tara:strand:+ start:571 stop:2460 length:1890 start_codon:yes stop_codon:yes gene_type:complete
MAQSNTGFFNSLIDALQGVGKGFTGNSNGKPKQDILTLMPQSHKDLIKQYALGDPSSPTRFAIDTVAPLVSDKVPKMYTEPPSDPFAAEGERWTIGPDTFNISKQAEKLGDTANTVAGNFDARVNAITDTFTDTTGSVSDAATEAAASFTSGLSGDPTTYDPEVYQGTQKDQMYAAHMKAKEEAIYKNQDPDMPQLSKKVDKIDITAVESELTPEEIAAAKTAGGAAGDAAGDGHSIKDAFKAAGGYLGDMFESKAVRNALMYYTMSRMMGYSGSGSGMAAGQVLMKGWEKEADQELKAQTLSAKNAAKKLENDTLDMSKTVSMFNTKNKRVVQGYMSKSGNFQEVGSDKTYKATDLDYVTYKPTLHKTYDEIDSKLLTDTNQLVASTLAGIKSNEENYSSYATAEELFADGNAVRDLISVATRDLKSAGVEYGTTEFRIAMEQTVQNHIREVASGKYEDGKSPLVADLAGIVESNYIKADLKRQGPVPQFVFEKATWDDKGNITGYDEDFKMQSGGESKLIRQANSVTNQLITNFRNKGYPAAKVNQTITKQKTIAKLAKIFQDNVMSDTASRTHWSDIAEGRGNNPFNAWLNGAKLNSDNKLNGVNSPAIRKLFDQMYDKDFEKKKK